MQALQPSNSRGLLKNFDSQQGREDRNERYCISKDVDGHILSTSAPVLAQPIAKRIPPSLPRLDSENTDSIVAQVRRVKPNIPQSQQEENEKWRAWLQQPPSIASRYRATKLSHNLPENHISPGISEIPQPTESYPTALPFIEENSPCPTRSSHAGIQQTAPLPSSSDTSEILARYEELIRRIRESQRHEYQAYLASNTSDAEMEQSNLGEHEVVFEDLESLPDETGVPGNVFESNDATDEIPVSYEQAMGSCKETQEFNSKAVRKQSPPHKSLQSQPVTPIRNKRVPQERNIMLATDQTPDCSLTAFPSHGRPKHADAAEAWRILVFGDENSDEFESAAISQATYDAAQTYRPFRRSQAMKNQHVSKQKIASKGRKLTCGPAGFRTPTEVSASVNFRPGSESSDITTQVPSLEVNVSSTESLANDMCLDERAPAGTVANPRSTGIQDKSPSLVVSVSSADSPVNDEGHERLVSRNAVESVLHMGLQPKPSSLRVNVSSTDSISVDGSHDRAVPAGVLATASHLGQKPVQLSPSLLSLAAVEAESGVETNQGELLGQPQLRGSGTTGEQFRFAPPKLFVGSRSSNQPQCNINPIHAAKRGRGRPKKRASDGRANIRTLPNYNSDPIEEFEELEHSKQSLFPPLEFV